MCNNLVNHFNLFIEKKEKRKEHYPILTNTSGKQQRKTDIVFHGQQKHTSSGTWQRSAISSSVNGSTGSLQLQTKEETRKGKKKVQCL